MRLNGSPLNGAALNGAGVTRAPQQAVAGFAYAWGVRLLVGGDDLSASLVGTLEVDREEGAAGLATFVLYIPAAITPTEWRGRTVSIDYLSQSANGSLDVRRFTGRIVLPSWDPRQRLLTCECSDLRQQRVEAMSVAEVDALVQGDWSPDLFDAIDGRSHWDYAEERLSTRPASLDCAPSGALRTTSWYAEPVAHFVFGPGTTLDDSVQVDLADLDTLTNVVEIEYSYRFARRWQENQSHSWSHPDTEGLSGIQGWCVLMTRPSTELPDRDMVKSALSGIGQTLLGSSIWRPVPPSGSGVYCDPPFGWTNNYYPNLLIGFSVVGARRWTQAVTEKYILRLEASASVAQAGEVVARDSLGFEVESEQADAWESTPFGADAPRKAVGGISTEVDWGQGAGFGTGGADDGVPGHFDDGDAGRRELAARCLLRRGQADILAAHRSTSVSFEVPTSLCAGIDLVHTVRLEDQGVRAQGKVRRLVDRFDLGTGLAVTTIALAIMRGGGEVSDPLVLPSISTAPVGSGGGDGIGGSLPTQFGGRLSSPPFDDEKLGFRGNYKDAESGAEMYPRDVKLAAREIPAAKRDEHVAEASTTYRVAIPNDILDL